MTFRIISSSLSICLTSTASSRRSYITLSHLTMSNIKHKSTLPH